MAAVWVDLLLQVVRIGAPFLVHMLDLTDTMLRRLQAH